MWRRANAALDARKTGKGPKGDAFANLFQGIAKCAHCGGSMKLVSTAKIREGRERKRYQYYRCSNSRTNACKNASLGVNDLTYNYAQVEREFITVFKSIIAQYLQRAEQQDDPTHPIQQQIDTKRVKLTHLEAREPVIKATMLEAQRQTGSTDADVALAIEALGITPLKTKLRTEIAALVRKLEQVTDQLPARDVVQQAVDLVANLDHQPDQYEARAKVNTQLRHFIARIEFAKQDGMVRVIYGENGEPYPTDPTGGWRHDFKFCFTPEGVKHDGDLPEWQKHGRRVREAVAEGRLAHARAQARRSKK